MIDYTPLLKTKISELANVKNGRDFNVWRDFTCNILLRAFGEDSIQVKQLQAINYWASSPPILGRRPRLDYEEPRQHVPKNNLEICIETSHKYIIAFVEELNTLGQPHFKEASPMGINLHVNQNQTVNLHLVVNVLRDGLTNSQFQELEEIVKSDVRLEEKKQKVSEKLKSFGSDVLSGVLSSLLTNPQVYQAFM